MPDDANHIPALDHPVDEFRRELQQSARRLLVIADSLMVGTKNLADELQRIKGYEETLDNRRNRAQL